MSSRKKTAFTAVASLAFLLLIIAVALATPVQKTHSVRLEKSLWQSQDILELNLILEKADINIILTDSLTISWQYQGFGAPKSRLRSHTEHSLSDSSFVLNIEQYQVGFFTEFQQNLTLHLPKNKKTHLRYQNRDESFTKTYSKN